MKKMIFMAVCLLLISVILLVLSFTAFGAEATLSWDANIEPDLAGYRVYSRQVAGNGKYIRLKDVGNQTEYAIDLDPNKPVRFVVTAYDKTGFESVPSEEFSYSRPHSPKNLRIKFDKMTVNTVNIYMGEL